MSPAAARWLAAFLLLLTNPLWAHTRIALVTFGPGDEYWSRFGHNGILVKTEASSTIYNFGYFDFGQPNFLGRFLRGRMLYKLVAIPAEDDLAYYAGIGRSVDLQWLRLPPEKAQFLATELLENARPENAEYRYEYFEANCSTKVRDALDLALGGELKRQTRGRSRGLSYRSEALRLSSTLPWLALGIDLGLGIRADRALSRWEEAYVPARLQEAVREIRFPDGSALVESEHHLAEQRVDPAPTSPPRWGGAFALVGIAIALALALNLRSRTRVARRLAVLATVSWWVVGAVGGLALLGLWVGTDHQAAWANRNVLLFNPLGLYALTDTKTLWRGHCSSAAQRRLRWALVACAVAAAFLLLIPVRDQNTLNWLLLSLPVHFGIALGAHQSAP